MSDSKKYDVIVVGLGAMGSSITYQLSKLGVSVLGIDQYHPPHTLGSSHGESRLSRQAIGEGSHYTPLVVRSHELWKELESLTERSILDERGMLILSSQTQKTFSHVDNFYQRTLEEAKKHGITHECLNASEIRQRFPAYLPENHEYAYFEHGAAIVRPEEAIFASLEVAKRLGARCMSNTKMISYEQHGEGVSVRTDQGSFQADQLILALGPWFPRDIQEEFKSLVKVYRQTLFWFECPENNVFKHPQFPLFIWELEGYQLAFYGFPAEKGRGIKVATEQYVEETDADQMDRQVHAEEKEWMYDHFVSKKFEGVTEKCFDARACLYSVIADFGFLLDQHPDHSKVFLVSACSGHGFKHSAAIGEAVAQKVVNGLSDLDISAFGINRLLSS